MNNHESLHFLKVVWGVCLMAMVMFIGLWDILVSYWYGDEYTVSQITRETGMKYPGLVLLLGYLLGHVFR